MTTQKSKQSRPTAARKTPAGPVGAAAASPVITAAPVVSTEKPRFLLERRGPAWTAEELERLAGLEWLETNGRGGWAASTVLGANTRRYHGVLVAALPPNQRMVYLSRLDETLSVGAQEYSLATAEFPGAFHPRGYEHLRSFALAPFPEQVFEVLHEGKPVLLSKTVAALHGENTTVIRYRLLGEARSASLRLRPFVAARDYHTLQHGNDAVRRDCAFNDATLVLPCYDGLPPLRIAVHGASSAAFHHGGDWWYRFRYREEEARGLDYEEDLFTNGELVASIEADRPLYLVISTEERLPSDPAAGIEAERRRRAQWSEALPVRDELAVSLCRAAEQFLVSASDGGTTILAGYHWFTDWGRDTMISLPGICLVPGRLAEARAILERFGAHVRDGMIPNRFPDAGHEPEYNTVDGTLWFFVACYRYLQLSGDRTFLERILPVLTDIVDWHRRGTRYGIRVDHHDGLLCAGEGLAQLTWMDVRIGDWVVTPRHGKPVEVNALWYNALCILAELYREFGETKAAGTLRKEAARVKDAFNESFWYAEGGYLYDVLTPGGPDHALRPNQLLALSLPFRLLEDHQRSESVLAHVKAELLTPVGLRTLAPSHPDYRGSYSGRPEERDPAYHQGTVWPWLLGPYLTALVRVHGKAGKKEGRALVEAFQAQLGEAGLGTISEIFDGDWPHRPRGCVAQAWSVAEILRAYCEDLTTH